MSEHKVTAAMHEFAAQGIKKKSEASESGDKIILGCFALYKPYFLNSFAGFIKCQAW